MVTCSNAVLSATVLWRAMTRLAINEENCGSRLIAELQTCCDISKGFGSDACQLVARSSKIARK